MATDTRAIPAITAITKTQWQPHEYPLLGHFVHFSRVANGIVPDGPQAGWFTQPFWRQYSYAPFNARVMENYYSLAFFAGYAAPWNIYRGNLDVLRLLDLTLRYTFALQGANGALPEYAPAAVDTPMLAPTSFGAEYMAAALDIAGEAMPADLRDALTDAARRAATYVLTAEESWEHARSYSNQFIGAMVAAMQLAQRLGDPDLHLLVERGMTGVMEQFLAAPGYLYENDGPETFGYFFVTLQRLIPLMARWSDPRITDVVRRHCAWMARWMLPEPDHETITLSGAHHTRTVGRTILTLRTEAGCDALLKDAHTGATPQLSNGLGAFMDATDERQYLRLFVLSDEAMAAFRQTWEAEADPIGACDWRLSHGQYAPVSTLHGLPPYNPTVAEQAVARDRLPALIAPPHTDELRDAHGNQYVFVRRPRYYIAFAHGAKRSTARFGPSFLWLPESGTVALARPASSLVWETFAGLDATGQTPSTAQARTEGGDTEVVTHDETLGVRKTFVMREGEIAVSLTGPQTTQAFHERIPLLLREDDVLRLDYGTCPVSDLYEQNSGGFGVVSQSIAVIRGGRPVITFDFYAPVAALLRRVDMLGDRLGIELVFPYAPIFYRRMGYRITL